MLSSETPYEALPLDTAVDGKHVAPVDMGAPASSRKRTVSLRSVLAIVLVFVACAVAAVVMYKELGGDGGSGRGDGASSGNDGGGGSGPHQPEQRNVDCLVSEWNVTASCSKSCGSGGIEQMARFIVTPPSGNGTACPVLVASRPCYLGRCPYSGAKSGVEALVGRPFDGTRGEWTDNAPPEHMFSIFRLEAYNENETALVTPGADKLPLPFGASVVHTRECESSASTHQLESFSNYAKSTAKSLGFSIGVGFLSVGHKTKSTRTQTYNSADQSFIGKAELRCEVARVEYAGGQLSDTFLADLNSAHDSANGAMTWKSFFLKWGTHFVKTQTYGGLTGSLVKYSSWALKTGGLTSSSVSNGISLHWKVSVGMSLGHSDQSAYESFSRHAESLETHDVLGGDTSMLVGGDTQGWISSLDDSAAPIGQELATFDELAYVANRPALRQALSSALYEFQHTCPGVVGDAVCSGNGQCNFETGLCECDPHFGNADCGTAEEKMLSMIIHRGHFSLSEPGDDDWYWRVTGKDGKQMCSKTIAAKCGNDCDFNGAMRKGHGCRGEPWMGIFPLPCTSDGCGGLPKCTFWNRYFLGRYTIRDTPKIMIELWDDDWPGNDCYGGNIGHGNDDQQLAFVIGAHDDHIVGFPALGGKSLISLFGTPATTYELDLSRVRCTKDNLCDSGTCAGAADETCTLYIELAFE